MLYQTDEREVTESPKAQGAQENRAYSFDFTGEGVSAIEGTPTVAIYDWSTDPPTDVSSTKLSAGTPTVNELVVTTVKQVQGLIDGVEYRLYCRISHDGSQESELYCRIFGRA